jgi:long-chain acyl-CoA synthetase
MAEIRSGERVRSTAELTERAARAASGFASLGIGQGDTVALYLRNDFPFLEASLGAGMVNAYPVPVNWHYTEDEARYLFENSGAKAIVIHSDLVEPIRAAIPANVPLLVVPAPPEIASAYGIAGSSAMPPHAQDWDIWLAGFAPRQAVATEPPGTMIYTSGTTGRPKGVRRNPPTPEQVQLGGMLLARGFGFLPWLATPEEIVTVVTGPMYHSAPNAYGVSSTRLGANVILEPRFEAEELLQLIEKYRVTHLHLVPIMFNRLLKLPEDVRRKYDVSSLRFVVHAPRPSRRPSSAR